MKITQEHAEKFRIALIRDEKAAATIKKYVRAAEKFVQWLNGGDADKLTLIKYKSELRIKYSPSGINGVIAALNAFTRFLGIDNARLRLVQIQNVSVADTARELTKDDYDALMRCAENSGKERIAMIMHTLCATGIRISELRFITVETLKGGTATVENKGKIRKIILPSALCAVLAGYADKRGIVSGSVFVTSGGKPLNRSNIWREMKSLCAECGVDAAKVFPHNFRHLFARMYYQINKDVVRLADVLGHSSLNTTRIYTAESSGVYRSQMDELYNSLC